jgi:hypothetical protein
LDSQAPRAAGYVEVREVTDRDSRCNDPGRPRDLEKEPLLHGRPDTVGLPLRRGAALGSRYGGSSVRNGVGAANSCRRKPFPIWAQGPNGDVWLGFQDDRRTGELEFVTAAFQDRKRLR